MSTIFMILLVVFAILAFTFVAMLKLKMDEYDKRNEITEQLTDKTRT